MENLEHITVGGGEEGRQRRREKSSNVTLLKVDCHGANDAVIDLRGDTDRSNVLPMAVEGLRETRIPK